MIQGKSKVSIIGAGFVGASAAYNIAINQTVSEIVLIDVNHDKAMGEALDINHGLCHLEQMNIHAGDYSDCADSDIVVITAGLNRKPGETRLDLANKNIPIAKDITKNIMKNYRNAVIMVVANPADILTYLIQKWSGLPVGKVMGTGTALDSARFRFYLAQKLHVDVHNVHGYVIGEHGDAQIPLWSATQIAGQSVDEYCEFHRPGMQDVGERRDRQQDQDGRRGRDQIEGGYVFCHCRHYTKRGAGHHQGYQFH